MEEDQWKGEINEEMSSKKEKRKKNYKLKSHLNDNNLWFSVFFFYGIQSILNHEAKCMQAQYAI